MFAYSLSLPNPPEMQPIFDEPNLPHQDAWHTDMEIARSLLPLREYVTIEKFLWDASIQGHADIPYVALFKDGTQEVLVATVDSKDVKELTPQSETALPPAWELLGPHARHKSEVKLLRWIIGYMIMWRYDTSYYGLMA